MKKEFTLAYLLFALILAVAIALAASHFVSAMKAERAMMPCPVRMTDVISSVQGDVYDMHGITEYTEPDLYILADYTVDGDSISNPHYEFVPGDLKNKRASTALQAEEAWQTFADIIPEKDRAMVGEYMVFTDGIDNTLAAVDQNHEDVTQWTLEIDIADLEDKNELLFTLVHEYAHILTLNNSQVDSDPEVLINWDDPSLLREKAAACRTYFTGTGCSYADSYIHAFYTRFWANLDAEWTKIDDMQYSEAENLKPYYDALYEFYKSHPDQFVDDYAVTHPTEDIAESFAYFVFSPKPSGTTIKEQKIAFFYQYPELVQLRADILHGACLQ